MSQWELKENPTCLKRGKTRATKSWLVLVLHLIGWLSVESFLDESQREGKNRAMPDYFPHSVENCSNAITHT